MPDRYLVTHTLTKDVTNEDLKDFLQESIEECFQMLDNGKFKILIITSSSSVDAEWLNVDYFVFFQKTQKINVNFRRIF